LRRGKAKFREAQRARETRLCVWRDAAVFEVGVMKLDSGERTAMMAGDD
jgi:hypothetical protein